MPVKTTTSFLRLAWDALGINVAVGVAILWHAFSYLFRINNGIGFTIQEYFALTERYGELWINLGIPITLLSLTVFFSLGYYSDSGVFTRQRYRALALLSGVFCSMLLLSFMTTFTGTRDLFPREVHVVYVVVLSTMVVFPRIVKPLLLSGARLLAEEEKIRPPRRVLVIGGAGYIGTAVTGLLLSRGYSVRILDLMLYGDAAIEPFRDNPRFSLIQGDFRNIAHITAALEGVDAVVHLGGLVGDPACAVNEDLTIDINCAATEVLAMLCASRKIRRFVFASTCSVYGISEEVASENSSLSPVSLYARSKIDAERVLLRMQTEQFQPTILRFATVFGWSNRPRLDLVVNLFAAKAVRERAIEVFGGDQWRPFVHVRDLARAIELCLRKPLSSVGGEIFNVGDERLNYQIGQIAAICKKYRPDIEVRHSTNAADLRNYRVSFRHIKNKLGFECEVSVEDGVKEMMQSVESHPEIDLRDARLSNVKSLVDWVDSGADVVKNRLHKADYTLAAPFPDQQTEKIVS